jgi:hypothetical protein
VVDREDGDKIATLEAADVELAAEERFKQFLILIIEEIEAAIETAVFLDLAGDLVQLTGSCRVILDGREEFHVAAVGRQQQLPKGWQTIDRFLHGRVLLFLPPIPMFYLAVVLEKGDFIYRGLDPQNQPKLVVQLVETGPMVCLIRVPSMRMSKRLPISS